LQQRDFVKREGNVARACSWPRRRPEATDGRLQRWAAATRHRPGSGGRMAETWAKPRSVRVHGQVTEAGDISSAIASGHLAARKVLGLRGRRWTVRAPGLAEMAEWLARQSRTEPGRRSCAQSSRHGGSPNDRGKKRRATARGGVRRRRGYADPIRATASLAKAAASSSSIPSARCNVERKSCAGSRNARRPSCSGDSATVAKDRSGGAGGRTRLPNKCTNFAAQGLGR